MMCLRTSSGRPGLVSATVRTMMMTVITPSGLIAGGAVVKPIIEVTETTTNAKKGNTISASEVVAS